jgi:hypothetical protein
MKYMSVCPKHALTPACVCVCLCVCSHEYMHAHQNTMTTASTTMLVPFFALAGSAGFGLAGSAAGGI